MSLAKRARPSEGSVRRQDAEDTSSTGEALWVVGARQGPRERLWVSVLAPTSCSPRAQLLVSLVQFPSNTVGVPPPCVLGYRSTHCRMPLSSPLVPHIEAYVNTTWPLSSFWGRDRFHWHLSPHMSCWYGSHFLLTRWVLAALAFSSAQTGCDSPTSELAHLLGHC